MTEYNNRGLLFRNFRKKQPKHPDVVGEATIDGRKFKIAGWVKPGKRGEFHSLVFTEEQAESESDSPSPAPESPENNTTENDIAF
jgi:hypothetical protein